MTQSTNKNGGRTFDELAASRRHWIEEVLRPWCQAASMAQLRKAELEWLDIAGKVDTKATLWTWAWERFPAIVHPDLPGVNETNEMVVTLNDGGTFTGYPDNRQSTRGQLVLITADDTGTLQSFGPFSIDQIAQIDRIHESTGPMP
ncbi:MAG: hypothetical protein KDA91_23155 [Planctomycetaceae bacterium]|nr:hypothetical protein [Planctomycetaceae bacterium]